MTTKDYYFKNKNRILETNKKYYILHKKQISVQRKIRYNRNKDETLKKQHEYYLRTKEERVKWQVAYKRNRCIKDPYFRFKCLLRSRIYNAIKKQRASKSLKLIKLLGCTGKEAYDYITSKLKSGMTWKNYGKWHIDHIRPCASFDLTDQEQQKQCFHYTNLQPLWAIDNLRKSDLTSFSG